MIEQDLQAAARLDFIRHFGDSEDIKVDVQLMGAEETIIVENSVKRAFYSETLELVKVINIRGDE